MIQKAMTEKKEYVKLWLSYETYFEAYSAAEVGRLVLAMIKYKSSGAEPEFSGSERFIWPAIKRDIDMAKEAETRAADAHRAAGAAGGRPKNQNNQNGFQETNMAQGQRTKDKGTKEKGQGKGTTDKSPPHTPPRGQDAFAEFAGDNEILLASLRDFEEMRKKDRHPMTERAKQILVKKLCELSKDVNEQIAILEQSTVSNWKSVYPLKQETQSSGQASQKKEFVFDEQWMREVGITCG